MPASHTKRHFTNNERNTHLNHFICIRLANTNLKLEVSNAMIIQINKSPSWDKRINREGEYDQSILYACI
jgi:hypothetical protein